jgi:hypothetical protein
MEEHRLRMLGNVWLRKTYGAKREEETGGLRNLHKECLQIYTSYQIGYYSNV